MASTPLDAEDALGGPLYAVAALLIVVPLVDFALSVAAPQLGSVQWRFAAVGLLSGFTLTPILGLALGFGVASWLQHVPVQRVIALAALATSLALVVLSAGFLLDVLQIRASVPFEGRPAFRSAWTRAFIKHALGALVLGYFGWRARRMIPTGPKAKAPRTVHVVSK